MKPIVSKINIQKTLSGQSLIHSQRLKNVLFLGLFLSFLGSFSLFILEPHTLPMTTVQITGHIINTDQKVLQSLVSQVAKGGFFEINLAQVQKTLLTMPWIKNVQVHKQWPNTLVIQILERTAVARWQELALVDNEGKLFQVSPEMNKEQRSTGKGNLELPRFSGPPNSVGEVFERYNLLLPRIARAGLKIRELGCNARKAWYMVLDNGVKLRLGHGDSESQLHRFLKVHNYLIRYSPKYSRENSAVQFDLRYTNGIAVRTALAE